jgi:hypothetical protein
MVVVPAVAHVETPQESLLFVSDHNLAVMRPQNRHLAAGVTYNLYILTLAFQFLLEVERVITQKAGLVV